MDEVDKLTRRVERKVYDETGIALVGIGVYGYNTGNGEASAIRERVREMVMAHEWALQFHGFHIDVAKKKMRFDVVMSFDINPKDGLKTIRNEVQRAFPEYELLIIPDVDVSD